MKKERENSIATRMLGITISIYLIIALFVSLMHVAGEYKFQKKAISDSLEGVLTGFEGALSVSLWEFDEKALEAVTTGMLKIPEIVAVEVYDSEEKLIAAGGSRGKAKSTGSPVFQINMEGVSPEEIEYEETGGSFSCFEKNEPLYFFYGKIDRFVGKVVIYSNSSIIYERMKVPVGMVLLNVFFTLIVFSLTFLIAINKYLRKPLSILTRATANISIDNIGDFSIDFGHRRRDELYLLGQTISNMSADLNRAIKERTSAVDDLNRSENNLEITLNSIGDGVIATDKKGLITRMNNVAQVLTGWSLEDALGKPLNQVFRVTELISQTEKEPENIDPVKRVLAAGENIEISGHAILKGKDSREYRISESAAPIKVPFGEILGVVIVFRDITEETFLQQQLEHSQRMDAIGQLAGGVAHDFNNMLGGIIGSAELLQSRFEDDEEAREFTDIIIESSERAAELTGQLLSFARKQQDVSSPVDVHKVIKNSIALLNRTIDPRVRIISHLNAGAWLIIGDSAQLQSVFMNLGINASHAMPKGGEISIETKNVFLDDLFCKESLSDISPGNYVEIAITDTGEGIPSANLKKIFEPFFTTKEQGKGTGLGLAAVYGTIEQHKGLISVYSEINRGTRFVILLPLVSGKSEVLREGEIISRPVKGEGTVLIVDDEHVMRTTASVLLRDMGYKVILAEDGKQALEIFRKRYSEIDVVLLDMIMPNLNGRDCFKCLKEIDPDVKIILASGFSRKEDVEVMKEEGLSGFVVKPYRGSTLSRTVRDAIEKPVDISR